MIYTNLITTTELAPHLADPDWAIIDCRFVLSEPSAGRKAYQLGHIPGALYAHLDEDLSGPMVVGETGRHPLPAIETFAQTLSSWGIDSQTQVVAYDDMGGLMAGRLWWMLRSLGHDRVAVLDGDWRQWQQEERAVTSGIETRVARDFVAQPRPEMEANVDEIVADLEVGNFLLCDARDETRYRGEVAGMDPVGGHIPGAISAFFGDNLAANGRWHSLEVLQARYQQLLGDRDPNEVIFYCGSGVSAAHNLLAMEMLGLHGARLYVGSWSHWITDDKRQVETG